ncbi:hypothetical protein EDEG_01477 [Edhazardia aedis USNM 41457]|uniref:Uncharacterized protein n=1 Tax=Edhazardia aedis (strain USNM 41457) TaxID=1003232 RepID=J9DNX1_EDHAE|nr:hypothetical protein EDEG_01477 [Edhazardia aedis USNM 41457]|eukprot:EJW04245.1 hypothetical protein EDEG_01477 [Edhazardia aedis USNM 41457]
MKNVYIYEFLILYIRIIASKTFEKLHLSELKSNLKDITIVNDPDQKLCTRRKKLPDKSEIAEMLLYESILPINSFLFLAEINNMTEKEIEKICEEVVFEGMKSIYNCKNVGKEKVKDKSKYENTKKDKKAESLVSDQTESENNIGKDLNTNSNFGNDKQNQSDEDNKKFDNFDLRYNKDDNLRQKNKNIINQNNLQEKPEKENKNNINDDIFDENSNNSLFNPDDYDTSYEKVFLNGDFLLSNETSDLIEYSADEYSDENKKSSELGFLGLKDLNKSDHEKNKHGNLPKHIDNKQDAVIDKNSDLNLIYDRVHLSDHKKYETSDNRKLNIDLKLIGKNDIELLFPMKCNLSNILNINKTEKDIENKNLDTDKKQENNEKETAILDLNKPHKTTENEFLKSASGKNDKIESLDFGSDARGFRIFNNSGQENITSDKEKVDNNMKAVKENEKTSKIDLNAQKPIEENKKSGEIYNNQNNDNSKTKDKTDDLAENQKKSNANINSGPLILDNAVQRVLDEKDCKIGDILNNLDDCKPQKFINPLKLTPSIAKETKPSIKKNLNDILIVFSNFSKRIDIQNDKLERGLEKRNLLFEKDRSQMSKRMLLENITVLNNHIKNLSNEELKAMLDIRYIHVKNEKYKRMIKILRRAIIETENLTKAIEREKREFIREFAEKLIIHENKELFELKVAFNLGGSIFAPNMFIQISNLMVIIDKESHLDKAISTILKPIENLNFYIRYKSNTEKKEEIIKFLLACLEKRNNTFFEEIDEGFKARSLVLNMYFKNEESDEIAWNKEKAMDRYQEEFIKYMIKGIKNVNEDNLQNFVVINDDIIKMYKDLIKTGSKQSKTGLLKLFQKNTN